MATVRARSRVVSERDVFGKFISDIDASANRTVERTLKEGAKLSRKLAPSGERKDTRKGHTILKKSIRHKMTTNTSGIWYSTSKHAMFVEKGTAAHPMTGKMNFWWDNAGKMFYWNDPEYDNWNEEEGATIQHPGADAQPFLEPAADYVIRRQMMRIAKEEFR